MIWTSSWTKIQSILQRHRGLPFKILVISWHHLHGWWPSKSHPVVSKHPYSPLSLFALERERLRYHMSSIKMAYFWALYLYFLVAASVCSRATWLQYVLLKLVVKVLKVLLKHYLEFKVWGLRAFVTLFVILDFSWVIKFCLRRRCQKHWKDSMQKACPIGCWTIKQVKDSGLHSSALLSSSQLPHQEI